MSMEDWEKKVLAEPGAAERVDAIQRELITATDLEHMTPDQRAAAVNERIVTDIEVLPREFRSRVEATAQWLAEKHRWIDG